MCNLIENHCQILKIENSWPPEFNCENETLYPKKICKVFNFNNLIDCIILYRAQIYMH